MFDLIMHLNSNWISFIEETEISSQSFLKMIQGSYAELIHVKSTRIGLQNSDPIAFFAWFLAGLCAKKEVFLLSDFLTDNLLKETKDLYHLDYLCPKERIFGHNDDNLEIDTLDTKFYIFTTGTSGFPKAICHNFDHIMESVDSFSKFYGLDTYSWKHSLPAYHVSGLMAFFRAFLHKCTYFFKGNSAKCISLVPSQLINYLKEEKVSKLKEYDLILLGGQELPQSLFESAVRNQLKISYSFGMSETMALIAATEIGSFSSDNGKPLPNRLIKITDGKLSIKSPSNFLYFLQGDMKIEGPGEDYFLTNDLASFENDRLKIWGRSDFIFQLNGENINPFLIEEILCQLDFIEQAVVAPKDDSIAVFLEVFGDFNKAIIQKHIKSKLGSLYVPKFFFELNSTHISGIKIRRSELIEMAKIMGKEQELK